MTATADPIELASWPSALAPEAVICQAIIPGDPKPKGRVRFAAGRAYTPEDTQDYQQRVGWYVRLARAGKPPNATHDLGVRVRFLTRTRQRRDIDNLVKLLLDAGNGVIWRDDVQIVELHASVCRGTGEEGRVELLVYTVHEHAVLTCESCGTAVHRSGGQKARLNERFCSKRCYDQAQRRGDYVMCFTCGHRLYRQVEKLSLYPNHYCSAECKRLAKQQTRLCQHCGQPFGVYRSDAPKRPYCSAECRDAYHHVHRNPNGQRLGTCADCAGPCMLRALRCRTCDWAYRRRTAAAAPLVAAPVPVQPPLLLGAS